MKKLFALVIAVLFLGMNSAYAFSEVYYLKNTTVEAIKPAVSEAITSQDYKIVKQNPFYAKSIKYSSDYAVIILQQSGNNMFYYYNSNNNKKINKNILKSVKRAGIDYEQSFNTNIINVYDQLAQKTMTSNTVNNYVFTDNEPNYYSASNTNSTVQQQPSNSLKGYVAKIESGTKLKIYLQSAINTANAVEGDRVIGVISEDLIHNGASVIPQGSLVYGILTKARHASHGSRNGRVVIDFNQIVTPDGKTYDISTEKIDFTVTNDGKVASVAKDVLVGAIIGGLAGLLIGACSGNLGAATAISAGVGAGAGALSNVAEMGVDAEIPSFTEMELTLTKSFTTSVSY